MQSSKLIKMVSQILLCSLFFFVKWCNLTSIVFKWIESNHQLLVDYISSLFSKRWECLKIRTSAGCFSSLVIMVSMIQVFTGTYWYWVTLPRTMEVEKGPFPPPRITMTHGCMCQDSWWIILWKISWSTKTGVLYFQSFLVNFRHSLDSAKYIACGILRHPLQGHTIPLLFVWCPKCRCCLDFSTSKPGADMETCSDKGFESELSNFKRGEPQISSGVLSNNWFDHKGVGCPFGYFHTERWKLVKGSPMLKKNIDEEKWSFTSSSRRGPDMWY